MIEKKPSLGNAYALEGRDQVEQLYRDWAKTYDDDFVDRLGYIYPRLVAELFLEHGTASDAPILDVGCGSGVLGLELAGRRIDGIDLSADMLQIACEKGVYSRLIQGDLLAPLTLDTASYRGVVSTGTFTHGHVGPAALDELMRVAAPGALFCLGVNAKHFAAHGFEHAFAALAGSGTITEVRYEDRPIYDGDHEHADDRALIAVFRRL